MVAYQSVGCQLEALPHHHRSVKKIVGLVTQNGNFYSNLISKNHHFDLDLKNRYSTTTIFMLLPLENVGDDVMFSPM